MNILIIAVSLIGLIILGFLLHRYAISKYISHLNILQHELFFVGFQQNGLDSTEFLYLQRQITTHIQKAEIISFALMRELKKLKKLNEQHTIETPNLGTEYQTILDRLNFLTLELILWRSPLGWVAMPIMFFLISCYILFKFLVQDHVELAKEQIYNKLSNLFDPEYPKTNMAV